MGDIGHFRPYIYEDKNKFFCSEIKMRGRSKDIIIFFQINREFNDRLECSNIPKCVGKIKDLTKRS
jgi:hypothetical protein